LDLDAGLEWASLGLKEGVVFWGKAGWKPALPGKRPALPGKRASPREETAPGKGTG